MTQLGQGVEQDIQGSSENAKAEVMTAVDQQKASVSSQIAQQRNQVEDEGNFAIAKIGIEHIVTIQLIELQLFAARLKVHSDAQKSLQKIDDAEEENLQKIDETFDDTKEKYKEAAEKVGNEAVEKGAQITEDSTSFLGEGIDKFLDTVNTGVRGGDGDYHQYARDLGEEYKKSFHTSAEFQGKELDKEKDVFNTELRETMDIYREQTKCLREKSLKNLNDIGKIAKETAKEVKEKLIKNGEDALRNTVEMLDEQEDSF